MYNETYDFPEYYTAPEKIVCVYFVPRSGTNYLASQMFAAGELGFPLEYFSSKNIKLLSQRLDDFSIKNITPIIEKRTSPNGVFSFKWNSNYPVIPQELKPDYSIFIDRLDMVAQATSFCIAEKTGNWLVKQPNSYVPSDKAVQDAVKRLSEMRENTIKMIDGDFLEIYYEDLIDDSETIISIISEHISGGRYEDINNS